MCGVVCVVCGVWGGRARNAQLVDKVQRSDLRNSNLSAIPITRGAITAILDIHMNMMSNKMNEVMKVLTIIATIFIIPGRDFRRSSSADG